MPAKPTIVKDNKTALVVGYEGFVGHHLVPMLVEHEAYSHLYIVSGKKPIISNDNINWINKSINNLNFDGMEINDLFICYDASFFNSGGKYSIDKNNYKYFPKIILSAYRQGVSQVLLLSSNTANPDGILFTHRIRGLIEQSVKRMGFWGAHIFRPSILIGETIGQQWGQKIANQLGNRFDKYTGGWLRNNKPVEAVVVAKAMIEEAQMTESGIFSYSSSWLQDYASTIKKTDISKK